MLVFPRRPFTLIRDTRVCVFSSFGSVARAPVRLPVVTRVPAEPVCLWVRALPAQRSSLWIIGVPRRHGNVPLSSLQQRQHPDPTHAHIKTFPSASARRWLLYETTAATGTLCTRKCLATLFKCSVSVPESRANILSEDIRSGTGATTKRFITCQKTVENVSQRRIIFIQINVSFSSTFSLPQHHDCSR